MALGRGGHRAEASRLADELEARSRSEYVPPVCLVWARLGTGDTDAAMAALERLVEDRDPQALWIAVLADLRARCAPTRASRSLLGRLPRLPAPGYFSSLIVAFISMGDRPQSGGSAQ